MFIKQADYLEIYSACFEVTKDYGNVRIYLNFIAKMDHITNVHSRGCLLNEHILKILHSVTSIVPTPLAITLIGGYYLRLAYLGLTSAW